MKVLFTNELRVATFASLNENTSFPVESLVHQFLRYKYKATTFEDTITATLPYAKTVNSFWFGYSNAVSMTVRIYSSALVLLKTVTVDCSQDNGAEYFDDVVGARVIEIDAAASVENDLQIGGIALGMAVDFPLPLASFAPNAISERENDRTESGQVMSRYTEPTTEYALGYQGVLRADFLDVLSLFRAVGKGHVWADITEENHGLHKPLYCVTNLIESPVRNDGRVSFKITFTEAR